MGIIIHWIERYFLSPVKVVNFSVFIVPVVYILIIADMRLVHADCVSLNFVTGTIYGESVGDW